MDTNFNVALQQIMQRQQITYNTPAADIPG